MGFYRFMDSQYINDFLSGKIRFGRLKYYQLLEIVEQDRHIGDKGDGVAVTEVDIHLRGQEATPEIRENLSKAGFNFGDLGEIGEVKIENGRSYKDIDCFVLSLSKGDLDDLIDNMCSPERLKYAYDGCIEVTDIETFVMEIVKNAIYDDKHISEMFCRLQCDDVFYEGNTQDFRDGVVIPNAFRKDPFFKRQSEYRIVLYPAPNLKIDFDHIILSINIKPEVVRKIEIPEIKKENYKREEIIRDHEEAVQILKECIELYTPKNEKFIDMDTQKFDVDSYISYSNALYDEFNNKCRSLAIQAYWYLRNQSNLRFDDMDDVLRFEMGGGWLMLHSIKDYLEKYKL